MKIGLFGGSFDPIHSGHLIVAESIKEKLSLDKVIFVPAAQNPLKNHSVIASNQDRVNMIHLAIQDNPHFQVSEIELSRGGASYTIDTVRDLKAALPAGVKLFWIAGTDILNKFHLWKEIETLKKLVQFVIVSRPNSPSDKNPEINQFIYYDEIQTTLSSSYIRKALTEKKSIRYLVPKLVEAYIAEKGLYQK